MTSEIQLLPMHLDQLPKLTAAAAEDRHVPMHPTHLVMRGREIVGYASLAAVPMMFAWLHTTKLRGPESFRAWRLAEEEMRRRGVKAVCLPCTHESPLLPFMERRGYKGIFDARIHLKEL